MQLPTILLRIFLLYNVVHSFLLCLVPKKARSFLPHSWFLPHQTTTSSPSSIVNNNNNNNNKEEEKEEGRRNRIRIMKMEAQELKRVFQMFDKNGDGRITKKELSESLEKLGIVMAEKEVRQMIEKIDANGDGCVDMEEFGELYTSIMEDQRRDEEEDMREAFNVFDQNGDGFITVDELRSVLASLGLKQGRTVEECKRMIVKVDVDGDGMVDFMEFKQMMKGGGFTALTN